MSSSPQNPYESYLVSASAGSGKTYQLSRRYLFLVGAGADPDKILTVTFTKKAAGEMKARILEDATQILADSDLQMEFDSDLRDFWLALPEQDRVAPPRSALATAEAILSATQRLKISTIDSLFHEWMAKFPYEAQGEETGKEFPSPFRMLENFESKELRNKTWHATCRYISKQLNESLAGDSGSNEFIDSILDNLPESSITLLKSRFSELDRHNNGLWYQQVTTGEVPLKNHPLPEGSDLTEEELVSSLTTQFNGLIEQIAKKERQDECKEALAQNSLAALIQARVLTKVFAIHGGTFRAKAKDAAQSHILEITEAVNSFVNKACIDRLNKQGQAIYQAFAVFLAHGHELKNMQSALDFNDLTQGSYQLFQGSLGVGARYLISRSIHHILLDEFQDTSTLQWDIFRSLCDEMISGAGVVEEDKGLKPTVFIVGDEKQSIYGFREADPVVMGAAAKQLEDRLTVLPLSKSFRTSQVVLDGVNDIFSERFDGFIKHETFAFSSGPFVPNTGRVEYAPICEEDEEFLAPEKEAQLIAKYLSEALSGERPFPVWDKDTKSYRPLVASDCCILYRSSTMALLYESALREAGIPSMRAEEKGFFSRLEICDALALLRYMAVPADSLSLMTVLKSPMGRISDVESLILWQKTAAIRGGSRSQKIIELLKEDHPELAKRVSSLARFGGQCSPRDALERALQTLDAFHSYDPKSSEGELSIGNLQKLIELVGGWQGKNINSLPKLVSHIETLTSDNEIGFASTSSGSVKLMTVHKSKGLEYTLVVLADTGRCWGKVDSNWVKSSKGIAAGYDYYYTGKKTEAPLCDPHFDALIDETTTSTIKECDRLLYVALTRARQYLLVTAHKPSALKGIPETAPYPTIMEQLKLDPENWHRWESGIDQEITPPTISDNTDQDLISEPNDFQAKLGLELVLTSPSDAGTKKDSQIKSALAPELIPLASVIGDLIHGGLEAHVKKIEFKAQDLWTKLTRQARADSVVHIDDTLYQKAFDLAYAHYERAIQNPTFSTLINNSELALAEAPISYRKDEQLITGKIDLLIFQKDGSIKVVDYKTTILSQSDEASLRTLVTDRAYDEQIAIYKEGVQKIYPDKKITGCVLFTDSMNQVEI
jgi:ATP-dependent helicase/nuclease subunit A